jgi:hypothetical protein
MSILGEHIVELYENKQYPVGLENASLSVSSPLQPEVNIAYNVTRFEEIRACFLDVYKKIMKEKENNKQEKILDRILVPSKLL